MAPDGNQGQQAFNVISSSLEITATSSWPFARRRQQEAEGSWSRVPWSAGTTPLISWEKHVVITRSRSCVQESDADTLMQSALLQGTDWQRVEPV